MHLEFSMAAMSFFAEFNSNSLLVPISLGRPRERVPVSYPRRKTRTKTLFTLSQGKRASKKKKFVSVASQRDPKKRRGNLCGEGRRVEREEKGGCGAVHGDASDRNRRLERTKAYGFDSSCDRFMNSSRETDLCSLTPPVRARGRSVSFYHGCNARERAKPDPIFLSSANPTLSDPSLSACKVDVAG